MLFTEGRPETVFVVRDNGRNTWGRTTANQKTGEGHSQVVIRNNKQGTQNMGSVETRKLHAETGNL